MLQHPRSSHLRTALSGTLLTTTFSAAMAAACLAGAGLATSADAADWPQWRGEQRDGRSGETGLLKAWPKDGPPLAWRSKGLGKGYSSLAVVDGNIYTLGDVGEKQYVHALSAEDGSHLWKTEIGPGWDDEFIGARSTPTVDGDRVFAVSTEGLLLSLDRKTGKVQWKRNIPADFGGNLMQAMGQYSWKWSESPLVDGDRVIVTPGADDALLVAVNKNTGKEIWRTAKGDKNLGEKGRDGAGYSSVMVADLAGKRQYVQLLGRGVIGVDTESGKLLWHYGGVANDVANISTPVISGNQIFVSTGYNTGSALIEISAAGDGFKAEEIYFLDPKVMQNHHGGFILHDGYIYSGTGHKKGFPLAVKMDNGDVAWGPIRNEGRGSAAVAFAEDRFYFRYENGLMVLFEATPKEYVERGSFQIPDVRQFSWSAPVIADGHLFLREQDDLFAYDLRAGAKAKAKSAAKPAAEKSDASD